MYVLFMYLCVRVFLPSLSFKITFLATGISILYVCIISTTIIHSTLLKDYST